MVLRIRVSEDVSGAVVIEIVSSNATDCICTHPDIPHPFIVVFVFVSFRVVGFFVPFLVGFLACFAGFLVGGGCFVGGFLAFFFRLFAGGCFAAGSLRFVAAAAAFFRLRACAARLRRLPVPAAASAAWAAGPCIRDRFPASACGPAGRTDCGPPRRPIDAAASHFRSFALAARPAPAPARRSWRIRRRKSRPPRAARSAPRD